MIAIHYAMQTSHNYDYDYVPKYQNKCDFAYEQNGVDAHHLSLQSEAHRNMGNNTLDYYVFHQYELDYHYNQQQITSFATSGLIIS